MSRSVCALAAPILILSASAGHAGVLLYTIGADPLGAPTSLNSLDPTSPASVTNVQTPVGDGSIGFNGGLVAVGGLLYGIGSDNNGIATLYSFQTNGQGLTPVSPDFNTSGDAAGFTFQNGLGAIGNTFYAIGYDTNNDANFGEEALFQIGNGVATQIVTLPTFGGTYAGMAYDPVLQKFYAVIANGTGDYRGDDLVLFDLTGSAGLAAKLTPLDGAAVGSHLDGLADAGGGVLYNIFMSSETFTGQLEQITLGSGPPATTWLYDTGVPLAQNAGIALVATPEPQSTYQTVIAVVIAWLWLRGTRREGRAVAVNSQTTFRRTK